MENNSSPAQLIKQIKRLERENHKLHQKVRDLKTSTKAVGKETDKKVSQKPLEQSQALPASAESVFKVGGWEWDVTARKTYWTDGTYRIHGLDPDQIDPNAMEPIEKSLACYDPGDREIVFNALKKCDESGEPFDIECPLTRYDGKKIWVRTVGRPVYEGNRVVRVVGHIMDISESKINETALRRANKELSLREAIAELFLTASQDILFFEISALLLDEFNSKHGYLGYIDEEGSFVCPSMQQDIWSKSDLSEQRKIFPKNQWRGAWGKSLLNRCTILRNDNLVLPAGHLKIKNILVVPLVVKNKLIGQIAIANNPTGYTVEDQKQLESIGEFLAPILQVFLEKEKAETELNLRSQKLEEKNTALNVLIENREEQSLKLIDTLVNSFNKMVFPYHKKLRSLLSRAEQDTILSILETNTHECLSMLERPINTLYRGLTLMEVQVADLIKAGKSSKETAEILMISVRSVYFHRENIRKKFQITNTKTSLKTFLSSG